MCDRGASATASAEGARRKDRSSRLPTVVYGAGAPHAYLRAVDGPEQRLLGGAGPVVEEQLQLGDGGVGQVQHLRDLYV